MEPKSQSDTFIVHGQACRVSAAHPTCTHDKPGEMPGGRIYTIDITDLMGSDLPVSAATCATGVEPRFECKLEPEHMGHNWD